MENLSTLLAQIQPDILAAFLQNMMTEPTGKRFLWDTLCLCDPSAREWLRNCTEWAHETATGGQRLPPVPPLPK
jgi:hypothetical protein